MPDRVLIVDDEAMVAEAVSEVLGDYGYAARYLLSAEEAVAAVEEDGGFNLVLMDIWFGPNRMDGGTAAKRITDEFKVPVLFLTSYSDDDGVLARTDGVAGYGIMPKAFDNWALLIRAVRFVIARHRQVLGYSRDAAHAKLIVRDTNHRVKNSFAVMASLVRLQTGNLPAECGSIGELMAAQLSSFRRLHELLQQTPGNSTVPLRDFLSKVLALAFPHWPGYDVEVNATGDDPCVGGEIAGPIGLIASEIALNAVKHSFASDRHNQFFAHVVRDDDAGELRVRLSDNGPSVSPEVFESSSSTGMRLINVLVAQLEGDLSIRGDPSPTFELTIPWRG